MRSSARPAKSMAIRYERYAFREGLRGVLTGEYGVREPGVPARESAAAIAVVAPFVNRKGLSVDTAGFHEASLLTAGAWLSRHTGRTPVYRIAFQDTWSAKAKAAAVWMPMADGARAIRRGGECTVRRTIDVSGPALNVWLEAPRERAAAYLRWFAEVSFDVQGVLRKSLPYLALRDPALFADAPTRESLLVYSATRPYFAKVRGIFTWDVICPNHMSAVFRSACKNLPMALERWSRFAEAAGQSEIAAAVDPSEARRILARARRDPRALKNILWLEGKLVDSLLRFAHYTHDIGRFKEPPRNVHRFCKQWSQRVQARLRRCPGGRPIPELAQLALVEATASLASCMKVADGRRERVEVTGTAD